MSDFYAATCEKLLERVRALGKEKPAEVLACRDAWGLFALGLECSDLEPSAAQASACLARVKAELRAAQPSA